MAISNKLFRVEATDPLGPDATRLLDEMTKEILLRYRGVLEPSGVLPANEPLAPGSVYLLVRVKGQPIGCAALRLIDEQTAEIRRMYVAPSARRQGIARALLLELERRAGEFGYKMLRLETGNRQHEAVALYESYGFRRIPPYGRHIDDPLSLCFEKTVQGCA